MSTERYCYLIHTPLQKKNNAYPPFPWRTHQIWITHAFLQENIHALSSINFQKSLKQRRVHLIDQKCSLQNISTIFYRYKQANKTVAITRYGVKKYCWTECSPLKKLLGKRKRRGILSKVPWNKVTEKVFEQLGGKEAALGARIGSLLFGPVDGIVSGFIGSLFGSCDRYCAHDHVPVPGYVILQQYEKQPIAQHVRKSKCENNIRYVNGSTESVYECLSKTNCSEVLMDEDCIMKQREFS